MSQKTSINLRDLFASHVKTNHPTGRVLIYAHIDIPCRDLCFEGIHIITDPNPKDLEEVTEYFDCECSLFEDSVLVKIGRAHV